MIEVRTRQAASDGLMAVVRHTFREDDGVPAPTAADGEAEARPEQGDGGAAKRVAEEAGA